jgi:hypothetical protein
LACYPLLLFFVTVSFRFFPPNLIIDWCKLIQSVLFCDSVISINLQHHKSLTFMRKTKYCCCFVFFILNQTTLLIIVTSKVLVPCLLSMNSHSSPQFSFGFTYIEFSTIRANNCVYKILSFAWYILHNCKSPSILKCKRGSFY